MAKWSSTIISKPGKFVDGLDGKDKTPAKKRFDFPGMSTHLPMQHGHGSVAKEVSIIVTDSSTDPNYFDIEFEFELSGNIKDLMTDGCSVHCNLWELEPTANPQQQPVAVVSGNSPRECGVHFARIVLRDIRADRYRAAFRSTYAWFYLVANEDSIRVCFDVPYNP